jgi:succinate dehydrogenase/fumarate reductase cytochrome b subunit
MYTLQRVSGLVAAVFIVLHLKDYWWPKMVGKMEPSAFYNTLCTDLSNTNHGVPVLALWYVIGIAACVFHFANGLWGFCFSWGITVSRRSQRMAHRPASSGCAVLHREHGDLLAT